MTSGEWLTVGAGGESEKFRREYGENAEILMGFWKVKHRFGWLLVHLLMAAAARISNAHEIAFKKCLPMKEYWESEMKGKFSAVIADNPDDG